MKSLLTFIFLTIIAVFLSFRTSTAEINKEEYISKKVLELAVPFDVKIDTAFLDSLRPADE